MAPLILPFSPNNLHSLHRILYCGLRQGSPLSLILFNIYILEMAQLEISVKILLFADDIVLYNRDSNLASTTLALRSSILELNQNINKLHLYLSSHKCKSVLSLWGFWTPSLPEFPSTVIISNCDPLSNIWELYRLQIILKTHISDVRNQPFSALQTLSPTTWGDDTLKPVTISLIFRPQLLGLRLFPISQCPKKHPLLFEKAQNHAIRLATTLRPEILLKKKIHFAAEMVSGLRPAW